MHDKRPASVAGKGRYASPHIVRARWCGPSRLEAPILRYHPPPARLVCFGALAMALSGYWGLSFTCRCAQFTATAILQISRLNARGRDTPPTRVSVYARMRK